ncbi:MAG: hypothetical protein ACYTBP_14600 [Planctomycetota bacterium]
MSHAKPMKLERGGVTLGFPPSEEMSKQMCESNGRIEQIETVLNDHSSTAVKLKLETTTEKSGEANTNGGPVGVSTQKRNEILNDPAVKTVLMGLDARPIGIDQGNDDE